MTEKFVIALVCIGLVVFFRRALWGACMGMLRFVIGFMLIMLAIGVSFALAAWLFSPVVGAVCALLVLFVCIYLGNRGAVGSGDHRSADYKHQDEEDQRKLHEESLREDRRQQKLHEDARQRNPW